MTDFEAALFGREDFDAQFEAAAKIEEQLGLEKGFITYLVDEDDWSFTLKTHAVIEAAIEQAISSKCFADQVGWKQRDEALVAKFSSDLAMDGRVGKLSLAKAFGLINESDLRFARTLSELRNRYAHKPSNFKKSIREIFGDNKDGQSKLKNVTTIDTYMTDGVTSDQHVRSFISVSACIFLWSLEFTTQPALLRGLLNIKLSATGTISTDSLPNK